MRAIDLLESMENSDAVVIRKRRSTRHNFDTNALLLLLFPEYELGNTNVDNNCERLWHILFLSINAQRRAARILCRESNTRPPAERVSPIVYLA